MNLPSMFFRIIAITTLISLGLVTNLWGQMEKRNAGEYLTAEFLTSFPAIGYQIPELTLRNLDGDEVSLSACLGKTTVLIKGGYT